MERKGLDALIASTPTNLLYLTDVPDLNVGYALLPFEKKDEPFLITKIFCCDKVVTSDTWIKDVRYRGGAYYWETDPKAELTDLERMMKTAVDSAVMDVISAVHSVHTPAQVEELA